MAAFTAIQNKKQAAGAMAGVLFYVAQERGYEMSDYGFTNEDGKLMHLDTFSRHLRRIYDRNDFPRKFYLHTLRHYFVSTMLHNGVNKQTAERLGSGAVHADCV